ncbi:MAG: translation protein SH3-like domain-containing protein [Monoraphidium minutum]|nr:MAG: translation protein SH3-like domain-containing protein [Monoraphidium minutum]
MPSKPLKAIKPMFDKDKWRILRGDLVQIMTGKDRGLTGRVLRVIRDTRFPRVIVEGRNMVKKHVKQQGAPGFVVSMEAPVHYSNVMVLDPVTFKPVRTRWVFDVAAGQKLRLTRGKGASRSTVYPPSPHKAHPGPDTRGARRLREGVAGVQEHRGDGPTLVNPCGAGEAAVCTGAPAPVAAPDAARRPAALCPRRALLQARLPTHAIRGPRCAP